MNEIFVRALIKEILIEEVGRNFQTVHPIDSMFGNKDIVKSKISISIHPSTKKWIVVIDEKEMAFGSQEEAQQYANKIGDEMRRKLQSDENYPSHFRDVENIDF